jgi:transglutaminase-like putative cysteine protease
MRFARILPVVLFAVFAAPAARAQEPPPAPPPAPPEVSTFAIEMKGQIIGYYDESEAEGTFEGAKTLALRTRRFLKMSLLGSPVDMVDEIEAHSDPASGKPLFFAATSRGSGNERRVECRFQAGSVLCKTFLDGQATGEKSVELPADAVVLMGHGSYRALDASFAGAAPGTAKTFKVFIPPLQDMADATLTFEGEEPVKVRGSETPARRFLLALSVQGIQSRFWIRKDTGRITRVDNVSHGMAVYEADPNIANTLKRAEIDGALVAPAGVLIQDVRSLTFMKVEAEFQAPGEPLTAEALNVPGQKFTGTVGEANAVKGVFEISLQKYEGKAAPPFPPSFGDDASLEKHLKPSPDVESDHADVAALAKEVTAGAADSWQAAVRLAEWVCKNIPYEIPGGGTALGTLKARKGECGGHSRLHVALCRASGIPARVVAGAMYTPIYGGSFGQHAWAEVWMGKDAGWIPIDATAGETSFADAGHLRLGECGFRPGTVKILDYAPRAKEATVDPAASPVPYEAGKDHTFHYIVGGNPRATESFRLEKKAGEGKETWVLTGGLTTQGVKLASKAEVTPEGIPVAYQITADAGPRSYSLDCVFAEGEVRVALQRGGTKTERRVPLQGKVLLIDNNNLGLFSLLLSRFPVEEGKTFQIQAFHASTLSVVVLDVRVGKPAKLAVRGVEFEAFETKVKIGATELTFHLTKAGLIVKEIEQGGNLVIEFEAGK